MDENTNITEVKEETSVVETATEGTLTKGQKFKNGFNKYVKPVLSHGAAFFGGMIVGGLMCGEADDEDEDDFDDLEEVDSDDDFDSVNETENEED